MMCFYFRLLALSITRLRHHFRSGKPHASIEESLVIDLVMSIRSGLSREAMM